MKKYLILIIVAILSLPAFSTIMMINGEKADFSKIDVKENDVVFVSLRDLEQLGLGTINQVPDGGIEFNTSKLSLLFFKDSDSVRMNSLSLKLPMSTYLDEGKLMVPLSFIIKSLGADYEQNRDLIIDVKNLPTSKKTNVKTPELGKPASNTAVNTDTVSENTENASTAPEKITTEYTNPEISGNWFQGTVIAYGKRLNLIDVDLYDSNNKLVQTAKTHDGVFGFKGLSDGTYFLKIDHAKNPSFKTYTTAKFEIKDMNGNKIKKPFVIYRAIKSEKGCVPNEVNGQKCFMFTWTPVPNVANYKVVVSSSNKKAKVAKYDKKVEKINIPISDISKGVTYGVSVIATDKNGNIIGESTDNGWTFTAE